MYGPLNWTPLSAWHSPLLNVNPAGLPSLTLAVQMPLMQHSHRSISPSADFLIQYPSLGRKVFFQLCIVSPQQLRDAFDPLELLPVYALDAGRSHPPSPQGMDCSRRLNGNRTQGIDLNDHCTSLWGSWVANYSTLQCEDARRSLLSCSPNCDKAGLLYAPYWNQFSKTLDKSWIFNDFK